MFKLFSPLLLIAVLSTAACADTGDNSAPEELSSAQIKALEQRSEQRWQTLINKDFAGTYEFGTPTYRSSFPKELYVLKFSPLAEWELTDLEYVEYDRSAAVASVAVRVMSKPSKQTQTASEYGTVPLTFTEKWIFDDGQWWYSAND